jgi:hypothetical protein
MTDLLNDDSLRIALEATPSKPCTCAVGTCASWESLPEERWPASNITKLGTLRNPDIDEPTFDQHHTVVNGKLTHYDSVDAPISALYFPCNRCDAFKCGACQRVLLKYTEYGGYFVDQRVRWARSDNLVTAP